MTSQSTAIAVFVKTPGLSPIKTRLAAGIGPERSEEFYRLSVACIAATVAAVSQSTSATPYWAVAEAAGLADPLWQQFARISQGEGKLGDRLHTVFDELISQHSAVILIGGDSPQLTPAILESALLLLLEEHSSSAHVIGRSYDGGFYLFGSNAPIRPKTWSAVPYSTANTAESLAANLRPTGQLQELIRLTDVDLTGDLEPLKQELLALSVPSPEQLSLLDWLEKDNFAPRKPLGLQDES